MYATLRSLLVAHMEAAWNRGDFRGYMEEFVNPDVIFVSRGQWVIALNHVSSREVPSADTD